MIVFSFFFKKIIIIIILDKCDCQFALKFQTIESLSVLNEKKIKKKSKRASNFFLFLSLS